MKMYHYRILLLIFLVAVIIGDFFLSLYLININYLFIFIINAVMEIIIICLLFKLILWIWTNKGIK